MNYPSHSFAKAHILDALQSYWALDRDPVADLDIKPSNYEKPIQLPLKLVEIRLPTWAEICGVDGYLLVPEELGRSPTGLLSWEEVDWWLVAFCYLEGLHERVHESKNGPIHSYSFRLSNWDERAWRYAWVNRIALFIRSWASRTYDEPEVGNKIGPLPIPRITFTFDIDAVKKTKPIIIKKIAFNAFNILKNALLGKFSKSYEILRNSIGFLNSNNSWWHFQEIFKSLASIDSEAVFYVHSDVPKGNILKWLMDPNYDVSSSNFQSLIEQIVAGGHQIGLHPSFFTWSKACELQTQKSKLENESGLRITKVRQHWLRFSWVDTWRAQSDAGLAHDATLMFNDRPGFRNSAALTWLPLNSSIDREIGILATPTILMDSHFYDYSSLSDEARRLEIEHWIGECYAVSASAYINWHPHTLSKDFGWKPGLLTLIDVVRRNKNLQT